MRATIKDVAREAGVSVSTVSYTLNKKGPLTKESHKRVLAAAEKLGYVPDATARSLVSSRANSVALIAPKGLAAAERTPFYIDAVSIFSDILGAEGNWLNLYMLRNGDEDTLRTLFTDAKADGVVWMETMISPEAIGILERRGIPYVGICSSRLMAEKNSSFIFNDASTGIRQAVEHLKALGHKKIGIASMPPMDTKDGRFGLIQQAIQQAGLLNVGNLILTEEAKAYPESKAFFAEKGLEATAMIAVTDFIALQVMRSLKELGYSLPGDLSLVGFDDIYEARQSLPQLTTIRQPIQQAAEEACRYIFRCRDEREVLPPLHLKLDMEFVLRESTACPRDTEMK